MLTLTLLNQTFQVPCTEADKPRLIEAATLLEDKLDQVENLKGESKVLMVALNLCYDYLNLKDDTNTYCTNLEKQVEDILNQVASQKG